MDIPPAVLIHISAAFLVLILGPVNILRPRRDRFHKILGRSWVGLMYLTCLSSFFVFGLNGGFSFLHGLSVLTLVTTTLGLWNIIRGNVTQHRGNMIGSYLGTLGAFIFAAAVPQRLILTTATTNPVALALFVAAMLTIAATWIAIIRLRLGPTADAPTTRQRVPA